MRKKVLILSSSSVECCFVVAGGSLPRSRTKADWSRLWCTPRADLCFRARPPHTKQQVHGDTCAEHPPEVQKYIASPCLPLQATEKKEMPSCKTGGVAETGAQVRAVGGVRREKRDRELIFLLLSVLLLVGGFTGQYFLAFKGKHQNGEVIVRWL